VSIVTESSTVVIGVDTHTDTHTAALLNPAGAILAEVTVPADAAGAARLLAWADRHAGHQPRLWAVEGTRSHGIGLTRALQTAGQPVTEAGPPARRRGGKSDALDAVAAARAVLARPHHATPRADGLREDLRILLTCRRHYTDTRTATINLLKSLILTAEDALRGQLRRLPTRTQIRLLTSTDTTPADSTPADTIRRQQLTQLARTITDLDTTLADNYRQLRALITQLCPTLLTQPGVGPVTAATLLVAWSHPGRLRSEAAFAALAGVNPIPASSGRITRHRLNRGGDRHLNQALHTIATNRRRHHPPTGNYLTRRTTEGRTTAEITRSLKRYIARQLYRLMQANTTTA
jgi:transposase